MKKLLILAITLCSSLFTVDAADKKDLVDYVNPLVGSQSKISLSTGNTYPAIAMPWGMNFWMPQTGKMGDGWAYTYDADKIRGFKQTHHPALGSTITDSLPLCPLPVKWCLTKINVPAGFPIRRKWQNRIITGCIWLTMTL